MSTNVNATRLGVINDPLDHTHSPTNSDHYSHLNFALFCEILKYGRTPRVEIVIMTVDRA